MKKENPLELNSDNRRDFLKKSAMAGIAALIAPASAMVASTENLEESEKFSNDGKKKDIITLLITTDIHAQIFTHDEFFWENEKAVYKKRGGLAVLKTMIDAIRAKNPNNTIVYDGGDYFHGHAIASLTEGEALIPLFNDLG